MIIVPIVLRMYGMGIYGPGWPSTINNSALTSIILQGGHHAQMLHCVSKQSRVRKKWHAMPSLPWLAKGIGVAIASHGTHVRTIWYNNN
jgi:hypothetical protein